MLNGHDLDRARDALYSIPADIPRDQWVTVGMGFHAAGGPFEDFDIWSAQSDSYNAQACRATWRSFKTKPGGVGAGTLFAIAREHGWKEGKPTLRPAPIRTTKPIAAPRKPIPGISAAEVWKRCEAATNRHGYIVAKGATKVPLFDLRVVPADDSLRIAGSSVAGYLVVPASASDGTLQSLHFIPPPGIGKKVHLPGASMAGASFIVGWTVKGCRINICEGIGTAWACWQATEAAAVCCFGWGNVGKVAKALRAQDPTAKLVIVPDVGKEQDAQKIAAEVSGAVATMPHGWPQNSDVNDLALRDGLDVLALLLDGAAEPPVVYPLSVAFADELPETYEPIDELVEGVLTVGDGAVLYGETNSGKTYFVLDMACSVALGIDWMGRKTEPGLVVYLAAESPASVRRRLQAYQKHHRVKVPNFAIVQSPIDLFDGDADTGRVISLVKQLEQQRGQKVRLIIGDTLARLSAGANENAGQDMGQVVRRIDRIRVECKAHFLLIHHSGKAAAAGARGWSGVKAAVDTEIEVTDTPAGRCCEITKQRDLSTKGERIGFRLEVVTLGLTKWGEPATSCVVLPMDAPAKQTSKRMGEIEGAVVEFLAAHKVGIRKAELVKHFDGRYLRPNVYRALRTLVAAQAIHEAAGMVSIADVAK
jgi:hypothetical protein